MIESFTINRGIRPELSAFPTRQGFHLRVGEKGVFGPHVQLKDGQPMDPIPLIDDSLLFVSVD